METETTATSELEDHIREATRRQQEASTALADRRVDLPLRYWRQEAHFTTPAGDATMARKAIEQGTEPMGRMLAKYAIEPTELADTLGVAADAVAELIETPARAPLVMLDGEDAQAMRDDVLEEGLRVAADLFATADWGAATDPVLRFFRPPGFGLGTTAHDLYTVLWRLAERRDAQRAFPLDGIVFPKIEHPEEVDALEEILVRAETALGLAPATIRVAYLVESGWSLLQLPQIARRSSNRLCALIFGLADFSADLGLPSIETHHPIAEHARAVIVAVAGSVGVPAIDGMTLAYPVADPALSPAENRARILERLRLVFADAVRSRDLGMSGKWVGHPAQLFATLLAFRSGTGGIDIDAEVEKLRGYERSVEEGRGATMLAGVMSDRATDRHARVLLRRAVAMGRLDPNVALELGVVAPEELTTGDAR
jgi:citrate lyase beta subunit